MTISAEPLPAPAVRLRAWQPADAARMAELLESPAVCRFLAASLPHPYTVAHAREFIEACNRRTQVLERAILCGDEIAGTIGAQWEGCCARIGYWLGAAYWQRGIMSRALPLFIELLPPAILRLRAAVFDFNAASVALLHRCGFVQTAETGRELAPDGQLHPILYFGRAR